MRFKVKVEQGDIDAGKPRMITCCPIALATRRAMSSHGVSVVSVGHHELSLHMVGKRIYRSLPKKARVFIHKFDQREPVQPFEFTITLPKSAIPTPPAAPG